ncbi:hypothetical protein LS80_009345 [Helicobacter trogontum]|uniref:Uncharacterized protein n=1 Tax=Helicobacter trogontum TaxID=50960 RepID=A0A4U8T7E2_9HELI|nr:hypothetical protein [Helicobacter trogontum]TLD95438.1 hypothetical protein LS80_009345 [Helicobacter trogontum]
MEKVMYGVSGVLFLALCFISWRYVEAIKDLENESYKNVLLESKLDTQNKAIEKMTYSPRINAGVSSINKSSLLL